MVSKRSLSVPRTLAVKAAPVGLEGRELEHLLEEVLAIPDRNRQS